MHLNIISDLNTTETSFLLSVSQYLFLLLKALHVTEKNAQLLENGYQLSLTLPLAFADSTHQNKQNKPALQQANICLISNDDNIRSLVTNAMVSANAQVASLAEINPEQGPLCTTQLINKKVDIVIVASDSYAISLESITQHIFYCSC